MNLTVANDSLVCGQKNIKGMRKSTQTSVNTCSDAARYRFYAFRGVVFPKNHIIWWCEMDLVALKHHPGDSIRYSLGPTAFIWRETSPRVGGTEVDLLSAGDPPMSFLRNPLFWDKKIRIAILALATYIALC